MQRFLFQLFWLVSVLMSEQEVLQNQPVLKLLLLLYAANNNRHLWRDCEKKSVNKILL